MKRKVSDGMGKVLEHSVRSVFGVCLLGLLVGTSREQTTVILFICLFVLTEEKVLNVLTLCSAWVAFILLSEEFVPGRFVCLGGWHLFEVQPLSSSATHSSLEISCCPVSPIFHSGQTGLKL